ncbi:MAG: hypothetical protein ACXQTI_03765 [Candidatus Nezhaarchaeales archaeon]
MTHEIKLKVDDRLYSILRRLAEESGVDVKDLLQELVEEVLIEKGHLVS